MQAEMFDTEEVPYVCSNCNTELEDESDLRDNREGCIDCWTNPECPAECTDEHDEPEPNDRNGTWDCPTTGETFRYDSHDGWELDRYDQGSTYVDGYWLHDPSEHDYSYCDSCDVWRYCDDVRYDNYGESRGCIHCTRDTYEGQYADHSNARCNVCRSYSEVTHHHPVTESVACESCATDGNLEADGWESIDALMAVAA